MGQFEVERLTPKALANASPGCFNPGVIIIEKRTNAEGVRFRLTLSGFRNAYGTVSQG